MQIPQQIKPILNVASGVFGLIAALLWYFSTKVSVRDDEQHRGFTGGFVISEGGKDLMATAAAQTYWSRWAALAASAAAFAQATSSFLPE